MTKFNTTKDSYTVEISAMISWFVSNKFNLFIFTCWTFLQTMDIHFLFAFMAFHSFPSLVDKNLGRYIAIERPKRKFMRKAKHLVKSNGERLMVQNIHCEKWLSLKWHSFWDFPRIWFWDLRFKTWGLEMNHLNAHNFVWQGFFLLSLLSRNFDDQLS